MSKIAHYLQEHLLGEVTDSPEVRRHFSQDASILRLMPSVVVYPRNESDVRKAAHFTWQLAQRGRILPITARGGGSNTSGSALGSGVLLIFTAHMNRILALDPKKEYVVVEPGATYDKLEQTLYTHGLFFPPYPSSQHYATIGGGIATNAIGEKSVKYGPTGAYIERLRVVLANGEVIETGPLSRRELNNKLGLTSFEGQVYRGLDKLLEENAEIIAQEKDRTQTHRNAMGYKLFNVKDSKHFDLTSLFVGSQGTLGIITEATIKTVPHNPLSSMALVSLNSLGDLQDILPSVLALKPSMCDMMNKSAVELIQKINPNQLNGILERYDAAVHLFIEFDDTKDSDQKHGLKNLKKLTEKFGGEFYAAQRPDAQEKIWKLRHSITTILTQPHGQAKAIPVAEDIAIPISALSSFLQKAEEIYKDNDIAAAAWGSAGDGVIRMQPMINLASVGDRQKLFKLSDAIYRLAIESGGSLSAAAGDGRIRAPYTFWQYSPEYFDLIMKVKNVFDPHGTLNPGVKTANLDEVKALMRGDYDLAHHHEHLPRS